MEDFSTTPSISSAFLSAYQSPKSNSSNPSTPAIQNPSTFSTFVQHPLTQNPKSSDIAIVGALPPLIPSSRQFSEHTLSLDAPDPFSLSGGFSDYGSSGYGPESDRESGSQALKGPGVAFLCSPASFSSSTKLRSCDVYIGMFGQKPSLLRFANWLRAELELQGVSCFAADRSQCRDARSHCMVESAMNSASFGVVILRRKSFSNQYTIDELRLFLGRKNLVPIFFGLGPADRMARDIIERRGELWEKHGGELWLSYSGSEKEWKEAVNGLSCVDERKLVAHAGNWRDCISEAVVLLGMRLGKRGMIERAKKWKERVEKEEYPFPRNSNFVGRKKELLELELILFGNVEGDGENECFELKAGRRQKAAEVIENKVEDRLGDITRKGKEPVIWRESEEQIEMRGTENWRLRGKNDGERHAGRKKSTNVLYGKGIACVSGESGVGKTELLLEFAYRFSQRYQMVLWVGGESRYIRHNYMSLLPFLGVDLSVENELFPEIDGPRSFKELEEEAIRRVRKELMRDIPFLIMIDNLESEKDWWDAKNVMELLPRFGGETHVIISTRLPRILNMEPLRLQCLSGREAMSLMRGSLEDLTMEEVEALKAIEEKLGRITLGLALVGAILSELPVSPTKLLNAINRIPYRDLKWSGREDSILRHNPFIVQLLDVCFSIFGLADGPQNLATRMVLVSGWFAPSPIPVSMLASAACEVTEDDRDTQLWKRCLNVLICGFMKSHVKNSEAEASAMLVSFGIARSSTKQDCVYFHDIIQLYARKRGSVRAARAMVQAISICGSVTQHAEHIWAACFLLFKFSDGPALVKLKVPSLLSFAERLVLPLATLTFTTFSRCVAAKELLSLCTDALDDAEKSFISQVEKGLGKSLHCICSIQSTVQLNPTLYHKLILVKATLLETRANMMLKAGEYDVGEELCRMVVSIRSLVYGADHPETVAAKETMDKLVRLNANKQGI
ncbi:uncharacterized protein LOC131222522 [Magnolia sinica]|uniref:uncharacterized protein LOC131222522 n=1 Tax=Magnolia sinica TaxID=86752 RepID=UPI0026596469|nr:uncharacterized protein LOC131222522 [Magnolia sinica]